MASYGLQISAAIERRMRRCRAPMRAAIRKRLDEIAATAGNAVGTAKRWARPAKTPVRRGPPLRFYVYEGYRVAYQLDPESRKVVVIELDLPPVD